MRPQHNITEKNHLYMLILWRSLLIISFILIGFAAGAFIGGQFLMPKGQGLATATIALGYGLVGALLLLVISIILAFKLTGSSLRNITVVCIVLVAAIYGTLGYNASIKSAATHEPDSAFIPAGRFTVVMERLDISDPYLFIKMEVNSSTRQWRMTGPAPNNQICSAQFTAKKLIDLRSAMDKLAGTNMESLVNCLGSDRAIKRLSWSIEGVGGSLNISSNCAQSDNVVGRALALVEGASHSSASPVKCD